MRTLSTWFWLKIESKLCWWVRCETCKYFKKGLCQRYDLLHSVGARGKCIFWESRERR